MIFCAIGLAAIFGVSAITLSSQAASNAILWGMLLIGLVASPTIGFISKDIDSFTIFISALGLFYLVAFNTMTIINWSEGRYNPDFKDFSVVFGLILTFWFVSGLLYVLANKIRFSIETHQRTN